MTATELAGPRPLRIVRRLGRRTCDVEMVLHGRDTVVADVAAALGFPAGHVVVDGHVRRGDDSLGEAGLAPGSVVEPGTGRDGWTSRPGPGARTAPATGAAIARVGGPGAAELLRLGPGGHHLAHGGAIQFSVDVSATGAVTASPVPGGSLLVDGRPVDHPIAWTTQTVDAWGHAFRRVEAPSPPPPRGADHGGTITFTRTPRIRVPAAPRVIQQPPLPEPEPAPVPFSWIGVLAPLPIGVAMAILMNPYFLLFTLLSPVMLVGRWIEGRWRARRHRHRAAEALVDAREVLGRDLVATATAERMAAWAANPSSAEWAERARIRSTTLWERRADHDDFLVVGLGAVTSPWRPTTTPSEVRSEYADLFEHLDLPGMPLLADLGRGRAIGIAGGRDKALALARAVLVSAVGQSGPADLRVHLLVDDGSAGDWEWCKWLPHVHGPTGRISASTDPTSFSGRLSAPPPAPGGVPRLDEQRRAGPVDLLVIDGDRHLHGRGSAARRLLADTTSPTRAIVLCADAGDLPAACTTVVDLDVGTVTDVVDGVDSGDVLLTGTSAPSAEAVARRLAGLEDPEAETGGAGLPSHLSLLPLLGLPGEPVAADIAAVWNAAGADPRPAAVVGVDEHGPMTLDLVADGPHGLLAGTTGAGKSELLRTWVVSLASRVDPEHLNFILIDFKGGGAFDACARLPHTVSVVTDLDEHLAARALRCLTAELRHREQVLRAAGVSDLSAHLASRPAEPLARLFVVVDEFATLAAELPDFIDSLVDIAQRGRSLGIHLLLATQRPAGVLDNKVKANTNLRIALRVQDDHDSLDVIGTSQAAHLRRDQAGRGYARFGAGEVRAFQSALVTGTTRGRSASAVDGPWPFTLLSEGAGGRSHVGSATAAMSTTSAGGDGPTDLDRLVDAVVDAAAAGGHRPPRVPWPDPLPDDIDAAPLSRIEPQRRRATPIGVIDVPDEQSQRPLWFDAADGSLLVYGVDTRDTTDLLATVAVGLAQRHDPDDLHLYVVDRAAGALAPLEGLPHCRYIGPDDDERILRLLDRLDAEIALRRGASAPGGRRRPAPSGSRRRHEERDGDRLPLIVLLIDSYASIVETFDAAGRLDVAPRLGQILRDGAALGIVAVATANNERGVPSRIANQIEQRLVLRLADPIGYAAFGLRARDVPDLGRGRAMITASQLECQIAHFAGRDIAGAVAAVTAGHGSTGAVGHGPAPIDVLGRRIPLDAIGPVEATPGALTVPLGVRHDDLTAAVLPLGPGEHAVVVGPARSGRSTALRTIAAGVAAAPAAGRNRVVAITPRDSALGGSVHLHLPMDGELPGWISEQLALEPTVLLIDDAGRLPAPAAAALQAVLDGGPDHLHVVAAGRVEEFRRFGSWNSAVAASRNGLILQPSAGDGDLLGVHLPLRSAGAGPGPLPPGRGYLVQGGIASLVQVAVADAAAPGSAARAGRRLVGSGSGGHP